MRAEIKTTIVDWDYDGPNSLAPNTPIMIEISPTRIDVVISGDNELDPDDVVQPRSVTLEMQADDGLRVMIYAFDTDEPRVFCVDVQGNITEKL
jgi:hypothetical protein